MTENDCWAVKVQKQNKTLNIFQKALKAICKVHSKRLQEGLDPWKQAVKCYNAYNGNE